MRGPGDEEGTLCTSGLGCQNPLGGPRAHSPGTGQWHLDGKKPYVCSAKPRSLATLKQQDRKKRDYFIQLCSLVPGCYKRLVGGEGGDGMRPGD